MRRGIKQQPSGCTPLQSRLMTSRLWNLAAAVVVLLAAPALQRAEAQATCKDGTASASSGRGACSRHGGVASKAPAASKKADRSAQSGPITYKPNASASVSCTDGTSSAGGRGACSRHGGIAVSATAPAPSPAMPAPAARPQPAPRQAPTVSKSQAPSGATAQCRDGTYSYSAHRSGTCSHHGGVATWM
jgi:Protein of unknown function (DUF3761)